MAISITLRNARNTIETAIVDTLAFAFAPRLPAAADIPTLRALTSVQIPDRSMRFVTSMGYAYQWQRANTSADDSINFVQPADVSGSNPGRWCKATSTGIVSQAPTGYLKRADLFNDDAGDISTFVEREFSNTPAMLLTFEHLKRVPKSTTPGGGVYWCTLTFTLFALDVNARAAQTARQGDPIDPNHPGTAAMIGDAMSVLAGTNLGILDVAYVQVADEQPVIRDLARARFIESLDLLVYCTLTPQDPNTVPLGFPYAFNMQQELADVNQQGALDLSNYVSMAGLQFSLGSSLTQSFTGGTVTVNGTAIAVAGASNTFGANTVTYRDINGSGAIVYTATNLGDPQPDLAAGYTRLGATVTDGTGVRLDRLLISSLIPFGPADKVDPPLVSTITISPTNTTLATGTPLQYVATAILQDASSLDVTDLVTWASDNTNTTFTASGIANTSVPGTAHITATYQGVTSNTATLTAT